MRSFFSFVFCGFLVFETFAQNTLWGQTGDTWYYTHTQEYMLLSERPLRYGPSTVTVIGSKEIKGKMCNAYAVNQADSCNPLIDTFYCFEENRVLYYLSRIENEFYPLYDFNMNEGDSLHTKTETGILTTYVDSVKNLTVDDTLLTVQYVHYRATGVTDHPNRLWLSHKRNDIFIIEGIGSSFNFFPWWFGLCHNQRVTNLRCFIGENLTYHYSQEWMDNCDSVFFEKDQSLLENELNRLNVTPNPANQLLKVSELSQSMGHIEIFSINGQLVYSDIKQEGSISTTLNVSNLEKGLYVVIFRNNESVLTKRVVIE
jgi:hypothetical protein